jgi:hypothetical protein
MRGFAGKSTTVTFKYDIFWAKKYDTLRRFKKISETKLANLRNHFLSNTLTDSLKTITGGKMALMRNVNYSNEYDGRIVFYEKVCNGVEKVAKIERISKKKAARLLIERGFSNYMGEKIKEQLENDKAARESPRKPYPTRFKRELHKHGKERGIDISNIV